MTRNIFLSILQEKNIDSCKIYFDNNENDGYYLRKNYFRWEVFYKERGTEYDTVGFPSESNALEYLLDILLNHQ